MPIHIQHHEGCALPILLTAKNTTLSLHSMEPWPTPFIEDCLRPLHRASSPTTLDASHQSAKEELLSLISFTTAQNQNPERTAEEQLGT